MIASVVNLVAVSGLVLVAVGLGHKVLNLAGLRTIFGRERIAFAFALGVMSIGLTTLILGHAGLLYPWLFRFLAAAAFVFILPSLPELLENVRGNNLTAKFLGCSLFEKTIIVLAAAQLLALLLVALAPPVGADALAYHLAVPKIYAEHHQIVNLPNHKHAAQPFLMEMVFMAGMLIRSDIVAQLFNLALAGAAGLSVYLLARRFFSRKVGIIAAGIFTLVPQLLQTVGLMSPEPAMAFFIMLSFLAVYRWTYAPAEQRPANLVLIAVLAAGIAGMKQSGAGHVIFFGAAVLVIPYIIFRHRVSSILRQAAVYGAITLLLGGGWYLRSYLMSGNPLHPYRSDAPFVSSFEGRQGLGKTLPALCTYPWNITMNGQNFGMLVTDNPGPLFLAFIPLLLVVFRPVSMPLKVMLAYAVVFAVAIFFTSQMTRFLIPVFGLTSIAAAVAVEKMQKLGKLSGAAAMLAIFAASLAQVGIAARNVAGDQRNPLKYLAGKEDRDDYLTHASATYSSFTFLNESATPDSNVLLLYGHEAYYLNLPYLIAGLTMTGSALTESDYASNNALLKAVRRLKTDYIYIDEYVKKLFYSEELQRNPHVERSQEWLLRTWCKLVYNHTRPCGERILIYKFMDKPASNLKGIERT